MSDSGYAVPPRPSGTSSADGQHFPTPPIFLLLMAAVIPVVAIMCFWSALPAQCEQNENPDYLTFYGPVAESLADGKGYRTPDGRFGATYPPGFPVMLAAAMRLGDILGVDRGSAAMGLLLVSMAISGVLIFLVAREAWSDRAALACVVAFACYPLALWAAKQPNSEMPFLPILLLLFLLCIRLSVGRVRQRHVVAGVIGALSGAAMLVRPIAIGLPLIFGAAVLVTCRGRQGFTLAAIVVVVALATVTPWQSTLKEQSGRFMLLSNNGPPSITEGLSYEAPQARNSLNAKPTWPQPSDRVRALMGRMYPIRGTFVSLGEIVRYMLGEWRRDPVAVAELVGLKAIRAWYGTHTGRFERGIALVHSLILASLAWSAVSAWRTGRQSARVLAGLTIVVLLYSWAMSMVGLSIVRYMVPSLSAATPLLGALFMKTGLGASERRERQASLPLLGGA